MTEPEAAVFTIGSTIVVTPVVGPDLEAEVMAFDPATKFLSLKTKAARSSQINIITVNVGKVKNIQIKTEPDKDASPPPVPQVEPNAIYRRHDRKLAERKRLEAALNRNVPIDAKKIFHKAGKLFDVERDAGTDGSSTRWTAKNEIIVMENIAIVPPYQSNNVHAYSAKDQRVLDSIPPGQKLDFVKKMVDKYYDEKAANKKSKEEDGNSASGGDKRSH